MMARGVCLILIVLLAACSSENTLVPTASLVPATVTDAPTSVPPTHTPAGLPAPADMLPTHTPTAEASGDPVANALVGIARRQIAAQLDLPEQRVRLVEVIPVVWTDSALNCPLPDQVVEAMEVDGYRILLEAGEREYLFHADVDRVVACDPVNEAIPTAEATAVE
jgi:hypothetical protein